RRPSRNSTSSSSSKTFRRCILTFSKLRCGYQFQDERASRVSRVVPQIAPKRSHESARQIETQTRRVRALLQRLKDLLIGRKTGPGIREPDADSVRLCCGGDVDHLLPGRIEGALAVLRKVQQDLHQAVSVRLYEAKSLRNIPT